METYLNVAFYSITANHCTKHANHGAHCVFSRFLSSFFYVCISLLLLLMLISVVVVGVVVTLTPSVVTSAELQIENRRKNRQQFSCFELIYVQILLDRHVVVLLFPFFLCLPLYPFYEYESTVVTGNTFYIQRRNLIFSKYLLSLS